MEGEFFLFNSIFIIVKGICQQFSQIQVYMNSSNLTYLRKDARSYVIDKNQWGYIARTNVLGCVKSPYVEIVLDDGTRRAYAGVYAAEKTVNPETQSTGLGLPFQTPLDVKGVGYEYLTALGVSEEQQTALFEAWKALSLETQQTYTSQWDALDKTDQNALTEWIFGLVTVLQQPAPPS